MWPVLCARPCHAQDRAMCATVCGGGKRTRLIMSVKLYFEMELRTAILRALVTCCRLSGVERSMDT